jgi:hypothetical protein
MRISAMDENNSFKYLQAIVWTVFCVREITAANSAEVNNLTAYKPVPDQVFVIPSRGFGLKHAAGALKPPSVRRTPLSPSRGMNRVIARPTFPPKVTVSDDTERPLSRRSRGASEVRRRPAADAPVTGVPPKDLAAPVPAGAVLLLGRLFYLRACLCRQAVGRRAPVPRAFRSLPHLHVLSRWSEETTEGFEGVQKAFAGGANV